MILPNKNIGLSDSLLGLGASILNDFEMNQTLSSLWERVKNSKDEINFEKFVLVIDFLFMLDLIQLTSEGILIKK